MAPFSFSYPLSKAEKRSKMKGIGGRIWSILNLWLWQLPEF